MSQFRIQREVLVFSGMFARGKNLLRKGSFPLALFFFQTFSGGRVRGGEERWGLGVDKKRPFPGLPVTARRKRSEKKIPASNYSPALCCAVPSSRGLLSIVFGMGTWVSSLLWTPGKNMRWRRELEGGSVTGVQLSSWIWYNFFLNLSPGGRRRKKKGGQASRRISTGKLKTLLFLHLQPIEVVVYDPPSGILLFRDI